MEQRTLGRTGLKVGVLGYGAGAVGGLFTKGRPEDQERAVARAIAAGINYFDTASIYGNGESEKNLGRVLNTLKAKVVVGTKVRLRAEHRRNIAAWIVQSTEESLGRMKRDSVDLMQLHNPLVAKDADDHLAIDIALNEVVPAMQKLVKDGKARFIGFSGTGEPAALHKALDSGAFDTAQIVFNAVNPSAGGPMPAGVAGLDYGNLLQHAADKKVGTIIIRALAGGAMAGTEARHELAMQVVPPIGSGKDLAADVARARSMEGEMKRSGSRSLAEYGMRFVISNPNVSTMLVGYSNMDQLEQAIAAVEKGKL